MNPELAIESSREAITVCMMIGGPILGVCLVVGLLLGLAQAMSQIQDQAISAVPKILAVLAATGLALPWMAEHLGEYAKDQFGNPHFGTTVATVPAAAKDQPLATSPMILVPASYKKEASPYYPNLDTRPPLLKTPAKVVPGKADRSPFELPHYRFSKLPGENREG